MWRSLRVAWGRRALGGAALALALVASLQARAVAQDSRSYADVAADAYYATPVADLAAAGVFDGTGCEAGFCPGEAIDRKTMAVWVVRVLDGRDPPAVSQSRFGDVDAGGSYAAFIERMAELEVTTGCGDGSVFCPDRNVPRAEMAAFISRAFDLPDGPDPNFSDVPDDAWYAADVARLAQSKITTGCGDGTMFCPGRDTRRGQMATFLWRAENPDWQAAGRIVEDANPGVFLTEENDLSRLIKHEIVDKYADEHPWLMEVWNYTNRPDFEYILDEGTGNQVVIDGTVDIGTGPPYRIRVTALSSTSYTLKYPELWSALIHELAHVYTLATDGVSSHPEPIAIAWLYFDYFADTACPDNERRNLFADAAGALVDLHKHPQAGEALSTYWPSCSPELLQPTQEAKEVVESAFAGEMPQWFYDTFQLPDGNLNYKAIWKAVKNAPYYDRPIIVHQLKDAFGGYCSNHEAWQVIFDKPSPEQPWRDGGC